MSPAPYLVASLATLRSEFNQAYPTRDKGADGWIADSSHDLTSDHQPNAQGAVRAIDIDVDLHGTPSLWDRCEWLRARQASGADNRLEYIIHKSQIASRSHGWAWRQYTGSTDPHDNHAHFSARHDGTGWSSTAAWGLLGDLEMTDAEMRKLADYIAAALLKSDTVPVTPASGQSTTWMTQTAIGDMTTKLGEISRNIAQVVKNTTPPAAPPPAA
jgi:hypothetical protein